MNFLGVWDGFHVYISSKMKIFYNFKHRNAVSNMGLVGYNKRFLDLAVGAPALHQLHRKMKFSITDFSTKCDQIRSFLRIWSHLLKKYCLNKYCKDKFRQITDIYQRFSWLLKSFQPMREDSKEPCYNSKLNSAKLVTKNAYGVLKGH